MKTTTLLSAFTLTCTAQLLVLPTKQQPHNQDQLAIMPDPPSQQQSTGGDITLSDILGSQKPISLFASFTRDLGAVWARLEDQKANTTLLAPVNSAISALPRKPWEDPRDYAQLGAEAYHGGDGSERAERNLRRFVEAHVVPCSPWEEGQRVKTVAGGEVWWEAKGDGRVIMPGGVEVESVAKRVRNGEVWVLKNVINYA